MQVKQNQPSLQHLSSLPVNSLKIDRGFISELHSGSNEAAVVRAIILLGKSLGKAIIAEGIETEEQLEQLREMGCEVGQGYHLSRPLPAELIDKMLRSMAAPAAPAPAMRHSERAALLH